MRHDLTNLKLFVAIAEALNITRAAARENIVLSAASKRVADMEAEIGTALLRRHARGVTLTPAGQTYLHYARQVLQTLARMDGELSDFSAGVKGHVRLHAIASAITEFLPRELSTFLARYPDIKIDLEEQVGPAIVRAVTERHADFGIITASTQADGLTCLPYRDDQLVAVVPSGHQLTGREVVALAEMLQFDLIGSHPDSSLMATILRTAIEGGHTIRLRMQVSSFDGMCRLIAENLGIGVLPLGAISHQLASGQVQAVKLSEPWAARSLLICLRDADETPISARLLCAHLAQANTPITI